MKKLYLTLITCCLMHLANAQSIPLDASTTTPSVIYQDANSYIGIGTTTPGSLMHINASSLNYNPEPDYFTITRAAFSGIPPNLTPTTDTKFIVKADGKVGIGTADPMGALHVKLNADYAGIGDFGPAGLIFESENNQLLGLFSNNTYNNSAGGCLFLISGGLNDMPTLALFNQTTEQIPFAVFPDGTMANAIDVSGTNNFTPEAQVNIARNETHDYLLKLQNSNQSTDYFDVHKNGFVGIGAANAGNASLQILSSGTNLGTQAALSVVGGSNVPRYIYAGNSTSPSNNTTYLSVKSTGTGIGIDDFSTLLSTLAVKGPDISFVDVYENTNENAGMRWVSSAGDVRHIIHDENDNLVINPGYGGGGNDKVVINGNAEVMREGSNPVNLDLKENSTTPDWNAQLRFVGSSGNARHIITEDQGNLLIDPGFGGGANDKLKVAGDVNIIGVTDIEGRVKIGNVTTPNANYMLFVEKGILAERVKVVLKTGDWSDYVFDKDYNLISLDELDSYIDKNKHLPNVPSANEVENNGVDLGMMDATLLRKIEELTLYVIDLKRENECIKETLQNINKKKDEF